jgi:hypothetical protein
MIQEYTELITNISIIIYLVIGVYVAIKRLDSYAVEDHGMYPIVATFLTIVWPVIIMYMICKYIEKKIQLW